MVALLLEETIRHQVRQAMDPAPQDVVLVDAAANQEIKQDTTVKLLADVEAEAAALERDTAM